jgi:hypothetical protein
VEDLGDPLEPPTRGLASPAAVIGEEGTISTCHCLLTSVRAMRSSAA